MFYKWKGNLPLQIHPTLFVTLVDKHRTPWMGTFTLSPKYAERTLSCVNTVLAEHEFDEKIIEMLQCSNQMT